MPEITFTRDTGSYTNGATVDMGAATGRPPHPASPAGQLQR